MILVDLRMPEVDGLDVLKDVCKNSPDTPIIVISGTGIIGDAIEAIRLGAWNYILKPIQDMSVLLHAVESALERAQLIKDNRDYQNNLEQKVLEQTRELQQKNVALKNSEEYFRSIIEMAKDVVLIMDDAKKIKYASPSHTSVSGYSSGYEINESVLDHLHLEDKDSFNKQVAEIKKYPGKTETLKLRHQHQDGSLRYLEGSMTNMLELQSVAGIVINYRDVTESQLLEKQLIQSQKMEAIGQLAGGVAHDFNNLLTVISGYSNLLASNENFPDEFRGKLEEILKASFRAEALTRQLLAFSRKQIVQPLIVDINTIINDSIKMLKRLIGEDIQIELNLGENLPAILSDPHQMEQILINLIVNARDAIHSQSGPRTEKLIRIETKSSYFNERSLSSQTGGGERTCIEFSVSDTGVGMDKDTITKIFEPFFTTKEESKGTGLGLSTVYGIVKQNNASIEVDSVEGEGATFSILWPVAETKSKSVTTKVEPEVKGGNECILITEDDDGVRSFIFEALNSMGYKMYQAVNGKEALEIIKHKKIHPQLLITDIVMPEMGGKELAQKAEKLLPGIKIIYTSGYSDNQIVSKEFLDEGIHFLKKPYSFYSISSLVREVLDKT